ncbi:MAG: alpha/beta fold hydrolase, partial [Pseudomonadota bacterium]|nr:alpha/beta fold hydrolase [Pseudomonadota bacterium]
MSEGRAFSVTADGLTYAGLEWGDPDGYPILALHGWLDNALSFSVIAPFLSEYRLIALDLSGQGLSDHRSPDATYHIWDDVPQLLSVVATLELDQLT